MTTAISFLRGVLFLAGAWYPLSVAWAQHPGVQPRPAPSTHTVSADGKTTYVVTDEGQFPERDPFSQPPGSNHLPTVYSNMLDGAGVEMPNTLPSTPDNPYNLHPDPVVSAIDKTSPTDDLMAIFKRLKEAGKPVQAVKNSKTKDKVAEDLQFAIDILEGNDIKDRVYSGFPLLHYKGPEQTKVVEPIHDAKGKVIGGNVNVHQIWYDTHIESDTFFVDTTAVQEVPWTITYTIDTLNRGHEDFAPMAMYFDDPALNDGKGKPHVGFDATFFPMEDGTRTIFKIGMSKAKYYKLTYHWGWRVHPPRVQAIENANQTLKGLPLSEWEVQVFGKSPSANQESKLAAIAKIGDLAPAKRMWNAFRAMQAFIVADGQPVRSGFVKDKIKEAEGAFYDWQNRNKLPKGIPLDETADLTIAYLNNTIYGQLPDIKDDSEQRFRKWRTRGTEVKIKIYNGDHFMHGYMNVDFGGSRGWENTFQSTIDVGGAGPWFSFGRVHWFPNLAKPLEIPPAKIIGSQGGIELGEHTVVMTYNYEPSRRLRFYQFDPFHHNVAVWSVH